MPHRRPGAFCRQLCRASLELADGSYTYTLTTNSPDHTTQGTSSDGVTDVFTYTVTDSLDNTGTSTIVCRIHIQRQADLNRPRSVIHRKRHVVDDADDGRRHAHRYAWHANDDLDFTNDPLDSIIVSQVEVKDALGFDVTSSVTIVDNLDGTVTVRGLLEGYQVFVSTADGFSRMEITNVTAGGQRNDSFDLGGFELTSVDAGDPIDMSFGLTVEDADGNQSSASPPEPPSPARSAASSRLPVSPSRPTRANTRPDPKTQEL